MDGASNWKRIRYITLPLLKPTAIMLIMLALGGIIKGSFELFYQIVGNNGLLLDKTDIIDTCLPFPGSGFQHGRGKARGCTSQYSDLCWSDGG